MMDDTYSIPSLPSMIRKKTELDSYDYDDDDGTLTTWYQDETSFSSGSDQFSLSTHTHHNPTGMSVSLLSTNKKSPHRSSGKSPRTFFATSSSSPYVVASDGENNNNDCSLPPRIRELKLKSRMQLSKVKSLLSKNIDEDPRTSDDDDEEEEQGFKQGKEELSAMKNPVEVNCGKDDHYQSLRERNMELEKMIVQLRQESNVSDQAYRSAAQHRRRIVVGSICILAGFLSVKYHEELVVDTALRLLTTIKEFVAVSGPAFEISTAKDYLAASLGRFLSAKYREEAVDTLLRYILTTTKEFVPLSGSSFEISTAKDYLSASLGKMTHHIRDLLFRFCPLFQWPGWNRCFECCIYHILHVLACFVLVIGFLKCKLSGEVEKDSKIFRSWNALVAVDDDEGRSSIHNGSFELPVAENDQDDARKRSQAGHNALDADSQKKEERVSFNARTTCPLDTMQDDEEEDSNNQQSLTPLNDSTKIWEVEDDSMQFQISFEEEREGLLAELSLKEKQLEEMRLQVYKMKMDDEIQFSLLVELSNSLEESKDRELRMIQETKELDNANMELRKRIENLGRQDRRYLAKTQTENEKKECSQKRIIELTSELKRYKELVSSLKDENMRLSSELEEAIF